MATVFATVSTPGPPGPPGRSPVYIVAAGAPSNATGLNGDMYIDSVTGDVYGPKAAGVWGAISCNIKGPTGATGRSPVYIVAAGIPASSTGLDGDMYINSTTGDVYGPKTGGSWGSIACNIKGPPGATGPAGPPGVAYTPRGAWSAATTYAQGDEATDAAILYISLQSSNLNHVPATSPTWWQPVGAGGMADPTTAKGDLIARGALAPATRLGIGVNGQVLTADSSMAVGMKWAAVSGGQTPWTSDIDAATFKLTNVSQIGIGTASPAGKFDVTGGTSYFRGNNNAFALSLRNGAATTDFLVGASSAGDCVFSDTNGTERMRITAAGNVGIGTTTPYGRLTVIPATDATNAPASAVQITVGESTANSAYRMAIGYYPQGGHYVGVIDVLHSGAAEALLLNTSGGNVGIGTTSPGAPLTVATAGSMFQRWDTTNAGAGRKNWGVMREFVNFGDWGLVRSSVDNGTPDTAVIYSNSAGNVGIGTTNPGYKLDVAGDINISSGSVYRINGVAISAGGVTTQTNVTGSRAIATVYQNLTGKPMFVNAVLNVPPNTGIAAYTDSSTSPTAFVCLTNNVSASGTVQLTLSFWVLPNNYYKVVGTSTSVNAWYEWN